MKSQIFFTIKTCIKHFLIDAISFCQTKNWKDKHWNQTLKQPWQIQWVHRNESEGFNWQILIVLRSFVRLSLSYHFGSFWWIEFMLEQCTYLFVVDDISREKKYSMRTIKYFLFTFLSVSITFIFCHLWRAKSFFNKIPRNKTKGCKKLRSFDLDCFHKNV